MSVLNCPISWFPELPPTHLSPTHPPIPQTLCLTPIKKSRIQNSQGSTLPAIPAQSATTSIILPSSAYSSLSSVTTPIFFTILIMFITQATFGIELAEGVPVTQLVENQLEFIVQKGILRDVVFTGLWEDVWWWELWVQADSGLNRKST